jgi:ketosteroid isomerase-like protein
MLRKLKFIFCLFISINTYSQVLTEYTMEKANQELITKFYTCFQNKDYKGMQACYADNATFSDPVFVNLNSKQVKAMWEMLCKSGKDLRLEFKNVTATDSSGAAEWVAYYTFSATGKKVINKIAASFVIENGKFVKHTDVFNLYKWSSQAIGVPGKLLGWTNFFKNKIRQKAMGNLADFMSKNN